MQGVFFSFNIQRFLFRLSSPLLQCSSNLIDVSAKWSTTVSYFSYLCCLRTESEQEKTTNCGTKAADVLAKFFAGKL